MKKKLLLTLLYIAGLAMIVGGVSGGYYGWSQSLPNVYQKTYYAALVDKVNHLKSHENDKKLILIGGSNVAFGFDSSLIETAFPDYRVVNFGLYAALGTKIMIDLSKDYIGPGDMVLVIPEMNDQSMSLYFSPNATWKALETEQGIVRSLPDDNKKQMASYYPKFIREKTAYSSPFIPSGVYGRVNFNNYGDIQYLQRANDGTPILDHNQPISLRQKNRMALHYDAGMPISFSVRPDDAFLTYLNNFSSMVSEKGAKLFYSWPSVNSAGMIDQNIETEAQDLYWFFRSKLSFPIVGNPLDFAMDPRWFYDTNFHLNDAGATYRTILFNEYLGMQLGLAPKQRPFTPAMPDYPTAEELNGTSESAQYFTYGEFDGKLVVSGMTQEGKALDMILLPAVKENRTIAALFKDALSGSSLRSISIPATYSMLQNGCFANASNLLEVHLLNSDPSSLTVNYMGGLFEGANSALKVFVPKGSLGNYKSDYNWSIYSDFLVEEL